MVGVESQWEGVVVAAAMVDETNHPKIKVGRGKDKKTKKNKGTEGQERREGGAKASPTSKWC